MEAAACARPATGYTYARREPEKTALFQVIQQHLLTHERPSPALQTHFAKERYVTASAADPIR
jgi:hypothetical protein